MTNDEIPNDERMTNGQIPNDVAFKVIRHSSFVIHSSLGISSFVI